MVGEARRRIAAAEVDVDVDVCTWTGLPARFAADSFDAVLCTGNAIAHARSEEEMVAVFRSFARVLAPGGLVVLDTHHWELLDHLGERTVVDPIAVERDGARCVRSYRWRRTGSGSSEWRLQVELDIAERRGRRTPVLALEMVPFSTAELRERLRAGGFTHISIDAVADDDRYSAIGRRG
jgi:SAM-dependent methyltransferase